MADTELEVPESLRHAAEEFGWPLEAVHKALRAGVSAAYIEGTIRARVTPEQAEDRFGLYRSLGGIPPLNMSWAKVPTDRLPKPRPGPKGLRLADVEKGAYGYVPDRWSTETDLPRGAFPPERSSILASYTIYDKAEVWAQGVAELYEDAIAERWTSAMDISWGTMEPLADHIEQSICQLMTNWSEDAMLGAEVLSKWLEQISYGFHEVKLYLGTQIFDLARHSETFIKRALSNGGGMGVQAPGAYHRAIYSAMKFTEVVALLTLRASFFLTLLETHGLTLARNEAERKIYAFVSQDLRRHLAYYLEHLKYCVQRQPEKRSSVSAWLTRGEMIMASELRQAVPQNEALVLLLDEKPAAAKRKLDELRRKQVEEYLDRLGSATVPRKMDEVAGGLRMLIGEPVERGPQQRSAI